MRVSTPADARHRVVIVGGGFGGLHAAKSLRDERVHVRLVDRRNHHLFQPLLYQVATGWLSSAEIASPLRALFRRRSNVEVLLGEVVAFDLPNRRVRLADGGSVPYDSLVVSAGSETAYLGNDAWREAAPGLKSIDEAIEIRHRLLLAFEAAEREADPDARAALLTVVVIGGGSTGVEMAGVVAELARDVLRGEFRRIDPRSARVVLVHSRDRILPEFPPNLSRSATQDLRRLGVELRTTSRVVTVDEDGVDVRAADALERIPTRCVVWAAGIRASPLADRLARSSGASVEPDGRIRVDRRLAVPDHPEVFAIGDMAAVRHGDEDLPGVAPVAMQEGRFVADTIRRRLDGDLRPRAFRYRDKGTLATIGRGAAVARIGPLTFDGFVAWLVWVFVHLLYIVEFQNRVVVVTRWAWDYFFHARGSRLILGRARLPRLRRPYPSADAEPGPARGLPERRPRPASQVPARRFGRIGVDRARPASVSRRR